MHFRKLSFLSSFCAVLESARERAEGGPRVTVLSFSIVLFQKIADAIVHRSRCGVFWPLAIAAIYGHGCRPYTLKPNGIQVKKQEEFREKGSQAVECSTCNTPRNK